MHDFYDRPVNGIADLNGRPHAYQRIFSHELDEYSDEYLLSPISDEQFRLIEADWARWLRWQAAFVERRLRPGDAHPVLAEDRSEHDRVRQSVAQALSV